MSDTDITDTFINAPVRTISGQQGVAIQLIDQSPIVFDDVIFRDLTAAHAAVQTIHVTRFLPPEVIVMHPRRWAWLLTLLDTQNRPLFIPDTNNPFNAAGVLENVDSQQVVGRTHGLPIVTDPNIATNLGAGTNEDEIFVLRASDLVLWESGIRARVLPETKAQNLTVLLQIYSCLASTAARYPAAVVTISGLTTPSF